MIQYLQQIGEFNSFSSSLAITNKEKKYTIVDFNKSQMTANFIGPEQDMVMPIHVPSTGPDSQVMKINYCSACVKIIFGTALNQQWQI